MTTARLHLMLWLRRLGWAPPLVLVALATGAALHWVATPAVQAEATAARQETSALQQQVARAGPSVPVQKEIGRLTTFEAALAMPSKRDELIKQLWQGAHAHAVRLSKIDYREENDAAGNFVRLHMRLPVAGKYPAVKAFVFELMGAFPALSLARFDITRQHAQSAGEVEATLHLILLMKS